MGYFLRVRDWDGSYRGYYRFEENWFFFFFFFFAKLKKSFRLQEENF